MKKTILSLFLIGSSCLVFAQDSTIHHTDTTAKATSSTTDSLNTNTMNNANLNNSMSTNTQYNAYGATSVAIPYRAQLNLQKDYPAASNITWTQSGDWYHGTYLNNGRYSHIYYNDRGDTYTVAMPIAQTYVPDDIMSKVTTMYGPMIYDVTTIKSDSTQNIYHIRTLENGTVKSQWIMEDGSSVMDPFRSDIETEVNTSTNAAMDGTTDNSNTNVNTSTNLNTTNSSANAVTTDSTTTSDMNTNEVKEMKIKTKTKDGKETKVKIEKGEVKIKED